MTLIQKLLQLQDVDQEFDDKAQLYQSVKQQLSDQSELETRRETQLRNAQRLTAERNKLRNAELELSSLQGRAERVENDLYSGRIRSPRELQNLRRDSEYLKRHISQLEDQALMAMTQVDDLEATAQRSEAELRAFEKEWAGQRESLVEQYRDLRIRLQQLKSAREKHRGTLGRAELALYDELRRRKGGTALSPAKNGLCQTCRVVLPSYKAEVIETGGAVVTCEGCGRIMYPER